MTHLIVASDKDNQLREVYSDKHGHLVVVSEAHDRVHNGEQWTINRLEADNPNLGYIWVRIRTGNVKAHVSIAFANGGDALLKTYANTTNYATNGTLQDGINMTVFNRNPEESKPIESIITFDPTFTVVNTPNGTIRGLRGIVGGSGGNAVGNTAGNNELESIIPPNSDFLCSIQNVSGQARISEITIEIYEED
jgi:hypothetical protein